MKQKILLADDVEDLAKTIGSILENYNYEVDVVFNGKQAIEKVKKNSYDCIILDIMMPVMDGIEAVKEMRRINIKSPIILLTAKDLVEDKVIGLDSGASDYLTKPFDTKELMARIRALTRIKDSINAKYKIGNVIFDKQNYQISKDNVSFKLNSKECEIIEFFIKNPEKSFSENEIMQLVWKAEKNTENIVPMYIEYLQEKFLALNSNIKIDYNNGYNLKFI